MALRGDGFQYDSLSSGMVRFFKLDINADSEPLSGILLSAYHNQNSLDLSVESFKYLWKENLDEIMQRFGSGYDALSYCWGNPQEKARLRLSVMSSRLDERGDIQIDHEPQRNGSIAINENLYIILQELRQRRHSRFIWIDAICIDQANNAEKSLQIPMMRSIYEYASTVYVWLGRANDVEVTALAIMPKLTGILEKTARDSHVLDPMTEETFQAIGLPEPSDEIWEGLKDLFHRPWWSRLWTLQEVVMSNTDEGSEPHNKNDFLPRVKILCGATVNGMGVLEGFARAATSAGIKDWILTGQWGLAVSSLHGFDGLAEIRTCRESVLRHGWGISLSSLLLATQRRQATVPDDMVFGMMAMLDRPTVEKLAIDITNTTEVVFVSFSKHYILNETKEVLLNHTARREVRPSLPSWCPNFCSPPDTLSLGSRWLGHYEASSEQRLQMYCAGFQKDGKWKRPRKKLYYIKNITNALTGRHPHSGLYNTDNPRQIALVPRSNHLLASGVHIDQVVAVVDCNPAAESAKFLSFNSIQQTHEWDSACLALAKSTLPTGTEGFEIYARTLVSNRVAIDPDSDESVVFDRWNRLDFVAPYFAFRRYMQAVIALGESIPVLGNLDKTAVRYVQVMEQITRRRRFFATANGRIGLGPADTRVGDNVCVVFFCPTPYLLRRGNEGRSRLVGEVFTHGLMYGEVLQMFDKGQVQEMKWVIE